MKILLSFLNQKPALSIWEKRSFSPGVQDGPRASDNRDRHAVVVGTEQPGDLEANGTFRRVAQAISEYRIFPPKLVERVLQRTPIQVGDNVGLTYRVVPGVRLFIACRVIDVFDGISGKVWRSGFTYRTLDGHVMLGEETFAVEKEISTGVVTASLTAWSRPGHWLTRVSYPYARWCQLHAGRSAIAHLQTL